MQKVSRALAATALMVALPVSAQFVEPEVETIRVYQGEQVGDWFGWVSANIPDINGDGVQELLIPAIAENNFTGRATLFSGADGAVLNDIIGPPGSAFGYSVGAAGDVDGDKVPDYIIGGGAVQVYSGATNALIHDLTATTGFGHSVSRAGDLNHDGYGDLFVGNERSDVGFNDSGRVFAISGEDGSVLWTVDGSADTARLGTGVGFVGDVNYDHVPDLVAAALGVDEAYILDGTDGSVIHTLVPDDPDVANVFGQFFASGAGDVNRDGVGDVFIGDYFAGAGDQAGTGQAYVFSGRTGRRLHLFQGAPGEGLGPGRGIPDVNGDRHNDIIVAGYLNGSGGTQAGRAYIFSGRSGALLRTITANVEGDQFGVDAIGTGKVDGDRYPDYLVTALGLSFGGLDVGRAYHIRGTKLPCPADLSGNRRVGFLDYFLLRKAIRKGDARGDLNGDSVADQDDLRVLFKDWGRCPRGFPRRHHW